MSLELVDPQATIHEIIQFLQRTFERSQKHRGVIAVSGGIDSAVSVTLLTRALGSDNVLPLLLPHHHQPMDDAYTILEYNHIPKSEWREVNIFAMVNAVCDSLNLSDADLVRKGNIKARCRMMAVYDTAKKEDALVCGTENKSEHFLGYFTRFGDAASDIEPICHLYKTQVRQIARELGIPDQLITKPPSAGLWIGQTDEQEMGFTYEQADQVLYQLLDLGAKPEEITVAGIDPSVVTKIIDHVRRMHFKLEVPYSLTPARELKE